MEAARGPNERLRHARMLRGWSHQRVADRLNELPGGPFGVNRVMVYRWEAGRRTPSPFYRERLCLLFTATAEQLGFVELDMLGAMSAHAVASPGGLLVPGGTSASAGDGLPEPVASVVRELWGDDVNRRAVLQLLGALATGAAVDFPPPNPVPAIPAGHADEVADHLSRAFPELSTADWLLGSQHVLGAVGGHLSLIGQLLPDTTGKARTRLLNVGARYAEFGSWLNQDSGNRRAATAWADRAMEWAQEAANPVMVSYILVRKSNQAAATRDGARTVGLAQSALRERRKLTSRGLAVALQQEAFGHALTGDERASQRALDAASRFAERSQQDGDEGPGRYCTPGYVEIQRAAAWIELGRPERAIELFEISLVRLPAVHRRDRGVYLARLASAYATSGSPEVSTSRAWDALTVAQATGSQRITSELRQLRTRLAPWESKPEVHQLLKELQAA